MGLQFLSGIVRKGSDFVNKGANIYVKNLLDVPSFEKGDTIADFQKYEFAVKCCLSDDVMATSLWSFKKDADVNDDNKLSAKELTLWLKDNTSLGDYMSNTLGINVNNKEILNNWEAVKEKLPFSVDDDMLDGLNNVLDYMDLENTTMGDVFAFAGALMLLDETTNGDLTKKLFGILDLAKQEKINAYEALKQVNGLFASFSPHIRSLEVSSAIETVIAECKKILKFNVSNYCGNFIGDIAGWAFEVHTRKQSGLEVGFVDNVLYETGKTVVKGVVTGLKTYTQLEEMRYEQDKDKSTTYRAMSGAAWGFRLR